MRSHRIFSRTAQAFSVLKTMWTRLSSGWNIRPYPARLGSLSCKPKEIQQKPVELTNKPVWELDLQELRQQECDLELVQLLLDRQVLLDWTDLSNDLSVRYSYPGFMKWIN